MKIRYGGRAAALSLGAGIVALAWTPIAASIALGAPALIVGPVTLFGAIFVLGGALMKSGRTYATIEEGGVVLHALVGPAKQRFPFESWRDVRYAGGVLTIGGARVPLHRTQANADDWHEFERYVAVRTVGNDAA